MVPPVTQNPTIPTTTTTTIVYSNDLQGVNPPKFNWDASELVQQFKNFRRYCELILTTPTYSNKSPKEIVNYILLWMGPKAVEIFDNWTHLSVTQKETPEDVWNAFQQYFEPKSNFRLARFQLRDLKQQENEPVDSFITRLKVQAQKCNFDTASLQEDNLIDQLIKGIAHVAVQKKILDQDPKTLTLDKALDLARTYEATKSQMHQLGCTPVSIDQIGHVQQRHSRPRSCYFCGGKPHKRENCPARNQTCNKCQVGHWGKVCKTTRDRSKSKHRNPNTQKNYNFRQSSDNSKKAVNNNFSKNEGKKFKPRNSKNINTVYNEDNHGSYAANDFESLNFNAIYINIDSDLSNKENEEAFATIKIEPYHGMQANLTGKIDTDAQGNCTIMIINMCGLINI